MVELIRKNKTVIIIVSVVLVLILIRSTGINHFKTDARKWAEPSLQNANTITVAEIGNLTGSRLVINLGKGSDSLLTGINTEIRNIPAEALFSKENIKPILNYKGFVLVYSSDPALTARIWMLLSQMGRKDLYILMAEAKNENLKYKLVPDSLVY